MNFIKRVHSFIKRFLWLRGFMTGSLNTLIHLIDIKMDTSKVGTCYYKGYAFEFLAKDMSAIREVLVDQEYNFLTPILEANKTPVILDVGANIGTFSLWAFGENPFCKILSLEASPQTYATITRTINLEENTNLSWDCENKAAWNNNDLLSFSVDGDSMGHKVLKTGTQKVPGITITQLIDKHLKQTHSDRIHLLKIDIEGAEGAFLENTDATKMALAKVDNLVVELHPNYCDIKPVETVLADCFKNIKNLEEGRISSKPLLHCSN